MLEEKAFEGSGAFLLGAVLDRFFAEYVAINHFTQTVVRTPERGEIMRWPPRIGLRRRPVTFRRRACRRAVALRSVRRFAPARARKSDRSRASATAARIAEEFVAIGQDPTWSFRHRTSTARASPDRPRFASRRRFLGMFGPQGALPLTTTEEAYVWLRERDDAFAAFRRRLPSSLPGAVLSRLGRFAAGRPARPAGRRTGSSPISAR